jgi:hypothetical protein
MSVSERECEWHGFSAGRGIAVGISRRIGGGGGGGDVAAGGGTGRVGCVG